MFALVNTERAAETIAVFIVTFLVTLALGRLLKRRAGVPFGIFFQLFALALAAYAAAWVYGMDFRWRNHVGAAVVFLIALLLVLSFGYHAERELRGLLATSGAAAIILAFATQNLLGGVIAGMSLQINKPYKVGDWLQVGERFAEV